MKKTKIDIAKLLAALEGTRTVAEVAADFGVSPGHVQRIAGRSSANTKRQNNTTGRWGLSERALDLMDKEGLTICAAAARVGLAPGSVRKYLRRRGLPAPTAAETNALRSAKLVEASELVDGGMTLAEAARTVGCRVASLSRFRNRRKHNGLCST